MDPNTTLASIRKLVREITKGYESSEHIDEAAAELASHVETLDAWFTRGGFLPIAWPCPRPLDEIRDSLERLTEVQAALVPVIREPLFNDLELVAATLRGLLARDHAETLDADTPAPNPHNEDDDTVYGCKCSWVGADPDLDGDEPSCPACLHHDGRRVTVVPVVL